MEWYRPHVAAVIVLLVAMGATGCASAPLAGVPPMPVSQPRPYLLHLPGVGGPTFFHDWYLDALVDGGFDAETALYDWTEGRSPLDALRDREQNRDEVETIVELILEKHRDDPNRPIYLSAESGGTAMAVWALESLPDDVSVEAVVLLAPAISSEYDLSAALRHVARRAIVVTSPNDRVVLGLGTRLFGTMDRANEASAGMVGFLMPAAADPAQYAKLVQHAWTMDWFWQYGHYGGHLHAIHSGFARQFLAPRLVDVARAAATRGHEGAASVSERMPEGQQPTTPSRSWLLGPDSSEPVAEPAAGRGRTDM